MQNLKTAIFPDAAFLDEAFLKTCLVYFDRIVVPPFSGFEASYRKSVDQALLFERAGVKLDLGDNFLRRYRLMQDIMRQLKPLVKVGIVEQSHSLIPREAQLTQSVDLVLEFVNSSVNDIESINVASSKPTVSLGGSLSLWTEDAEPRQSNRLDYIFGSITRLIGALQGKYNIGTNSIADYKALAKIQELAFSEEQLSSLQTHLRVREIIKMTVPRLIAKEIEDVVEVRERLRDFLNPFRVEITRIAANIPDDIPPDQLRAEARNLVDKEFSPKLLELERYLAKPHRVLNKYLVSQSSAIATSGITLAASVLTGGNMELAALLAPFVHLFASTLSAQQEISEKKYSNPLTFAVLAKQDSR